MAEQRDVQALAETVREGIFDAEWLPEGEQRRESALAALDSLAAELVSLKDALDAAVLVAAYHDAGGQEWWDAHAKLYAALVSAGYEISPAAAREALGGPDDA